MNSSETGPRNGPVFLSAPHNKGPARAFILSGFFQVRPVKDPSPQRRKGRKGNRDIKVFEHPGTPCAFAVNHGPRFVFSPLRVHNVYIRADLS
ncbi:MAG: hypothetical protein PVJ66_01650 [Gammaproteobacteria bacterium]